MNLKTILGWGMGAFLFACGPDQGIDKGTVVLYDTEIEWTGKRTFFDFPFPSDFRRKDTPFIDYSGFPLSSERRMSQLPLAASGAKGFSVLPVGYFRFRAATRPISLTDVFEPNAEASLLLIELQDSPRLLPLVAQTFKTDAYIPENLLAVGVRPGVVLKANTPYAFVVMRHLNDAEGQKLGVERVFAQLMRGEKPKIERGEELQGLHRPLLSALARLNIPWHEVAAATVFTTGDVIQELSTLVQGVRERHVVTLENLKLERSPKYDSSNVCHVSGTILMPQFQKGTPPFDVDGLFESGDDGLPVVQRVETVPVSLTLPRQVMPSKGFPVVLYFHGSGGIARQFVSGGNEEFEKDPMEWWPASVLADKGLAAAGTSLPLSPDRLVGASDYAYLNLENPAALRDTFRQGILESALFLDALEKVRIPQKVVAACSGLALPPGETEYRFSLERLSIQGQSMGGMYANLFGAVDPRVQALVPTGAGGYWSHFALNSSILPEPRWLLGSLFGAGEELSYVHPAMHLLQLAWDRVDPIAAVPRLGLSPLQGHGPRSMYVPIAANDSFFPTATFDAMAAAAGNARAGDMLWANTDAAISMAGHNPSASYSVSHNRTSNDGRVYTGAVVQHAVPNDDGHRIFRRSPEVRRQYACFHSTFRKNGVAVVVDPTQPCPEE